WPAVLMLPLAPLVAGIAFTMGVMDVLQGGQLSGGTLFVLAAYFISPYLFFPQAMVHMTVRHRFKAWILWDQLLVFFKNAGATIYWWVVAVCVWLPIIVLLVLSGLNLDSVFNWTYDKLDAVAAWMFGFVIDVGTPEERPLFFSILFSAFLPVGVAFIAAPIAFLAGFPAVFMMRATGLYGYYRRETLDLVTHVKANQPAGFWVRFLCRTIDTAVIGIFHVLMFWIPVVLVQFEVPLGRLFGGLFLAFTNLGFVAIAGSKNGRVSMASLGMGALAGVMFIMGETVPFFALVYSVLYFVLPAFNAWMYFATNEASTNRSTIGKEAFGLIVQIIDNQKELTLGQATTRHFGRLICDALAGLPYVIIAFHPKKQALHDIMAKSEVVFRGDK
ncbi:MAG: RDD family protein, partial [Planctomycetaceae bacterium]